MNDRFAYPPRGLRREAAARYIGIGATKFDEMVQDGRMPRPKKIDSCIVWDRMALDTAFSHLPDTTPDNFFDNAFASKAANEEPRAYSPRTLAERWCCSDKHVRNMIDRGELKNFNLGKLLRISKEEVERYEADKMVVPNVSKA